MTLDSSINFIKIERKLFLICFAIICSENNKSRDDSPSKQQPNNVAQKSDNECLDGGLSVVLDLTKAYDERRDKSPNDKRRCLRR